MNVTNSELRRRARETLGKDIFGQKWLMALAVSFVLSAILGTASSITGGIGSIILTGPLMFGLYKSFLIAKRTGKETSFDTAFDGFKNFSQTLLIGLMSAIFVMLWALLFIIPGIIKSYAYSMAYYIAVDHPEYDWKKCLDESQKMMNGNKWKLFCLDLSFIGWIIVGALCLGIGTLWVTPYQYAARTEFYNAIKGNEYSTENCQADDYI